MLSCKPWFRLTIFTWIYAYLYSKWTKTNINFLTLVKKYRLCSCTVIFSHFLGRLRKRSLHRAAMVMVDDVLVRFTIAEFHTKIFVDYEFWPLLMWWLDNCIFSLHVDPFFFLMHSFENVHNAGNQKKKTDYCCNIFWRSGPSQISTQIY